TKLHHNGHNQFTCNLISPGIGRVAREQQSISAYQVARHPLAS
ncbi:hypothetical protein F441_16387, partial [Phytophthora nicotianae CJ01A1]